MPQRRFTPGFRLSALDAAILLAGGATAFFVPKPVAIVVATAVGHFFLFCNVFRIGRRPELLWAACYLALATCTLAFGTPGWLASTLIALGLAGLLIGLEMRKPSYHGLWWRRINPGLQRWWETQARG